ncbi:molybdenum cofactor biosynthesis protein [Marinithermofilum abyssi]|uniref:Molybdenum cofactor biosynthesis protein n=2 Tax=Marinithermofilum abyssi TaxID=1571185 RepID=A0A8J2YD99_9BACL|nr:molybdenum cofactor biosynthesis protein [Marinithermofilum abyssi]
MWRVGILTCSDKGSRGEREDRSGDEIRRMVSRMDGEVIRYEVVADDLDIIREKLVQMADEDQLDLIVTTGGTGLSPRDVTPEATRAVIHREVPGIAEAMRVATLKKTPYAMLSRAVAGTRNTTLIFNVPGSPKAVRECLDVVMDVLPHALETLSGRYGDHE